jgi:hypothetical protein
VLGHNAGLYVTDAEVRGQSPDQRCAARQQRSRLIGDELRRFLNAKLVQISLKSTLARAVRYALTRCHGFTRLLNGGRIEFDRNCVERWIRPLALSRKNVLFAGSDDGDYWAVIASLVETAKLNGIDPKAWLTVTLTKLRAEHGARRIANSCVGNHPQLWPESSAYIKLQRPGARGRAWL